MIQYKERKNTNCIKWDGLDSIYGQENLLPLWVADMDFPAPGCVTDALKKYVEFGVFGYYKVPDSYYEAFINWERSQHDFTVQREWMRFSPGIVSAFHWLVQFLTEPKDSVLVMTPVYYPFFNAVNHNDRTLVTCELKNTAGAYSIDFEDFEKKITEHDVKLFIHCSPHNPAGRVWKREELTRLFEICRKHHVFVISDEIHQDLTYGDAKHLPSLSVGNYNDMMISLTAPSKTFNLAGCQNSIILIPNEEIRKKWDDFTRALEVTFGNAFGYIAAEAAYQGGLPWLNELRELLYGNYLTIKTRLKKDLPNAVLTPLEGTYLAWIDLGSYLKPEELESFMQKKCGLAFDYGHWFGGEHFATHIRINLATKKENIEAALDAIISNLSK